MPRLTGAVGSFDRTRPLLDGRVTVEGFDVDWTSGELEALFSRAFASAEFDVTELSFCNYLIATARGGCPYAALPIFPTRVFRHHALFVNTGAGIRGPRDLEGRRVGLREYTNTVSLVVRGVLSDYYGVDLSRIRWVVGDVDRRERDAIAVPALPAPYEIAVERDRLLADLLAEGAIDALCAYAPPRTHDGRRVARLFPRWWEEERRYYRDTGIFPIMHVIVVRRALAERHPGLPHALVDAFARARDLAMEELAIEQAPKVMLPWAAAHHHETVALMGERYWPYGVGRNRVALEAQIRFAREQHLIARDVPLDEFFLRGLEDAPER